MKTSISLRGGASILVLLTVLVLSSCQKKAEETTDGNSQNPAGESATTPAAVATPAGEATPASSAAAGKLGVAPTGKNCPANASVKGVTSKKQGKVYHTTKYPDYKTVSAEKCFADVAAAEKAGYKAPK